MSSKRNISGRKPQFGRSRSKAFNTTNRKFRLNLQTKRIFVSELGKHVRIRVTTKELKTIDKIGLLAFLKRRGISIKTLIGE